jgi:hypothetical protein
MNAGTSGAPATFYHFFPHYTDFVGKKQVVLLVFSTRLARCDRFAMLSFPTFSPLESPHWRDYALLDSGDGLKLERFGAYTFVRPEAQAMWPRALPEKEWAAAHAVFQPTGEESGGHWEFRKKIEEQTKPRTTISVGVASYPDCGDNVNQLIEAADQGLYRSKEKGRNAVSYMSKY